MLMLDYVYIYFYLFFHTQKISLFNRTLENMQKRTLIIAISILIVMLLACHLANFFYPKNNVINLGTPVTTFNNTYNRITYEPPLTQQISCQPHAQLPCPDKPIEERCPTSYKPTPVDEALFYKFAYEAAGLEVMNRTVNSTTPQTSMPQIETFY